MHPTTPSSTDNAAPGTSPDLAHSLQFETLKEITTLASAGAGLAVTLAGSVLKSFSFAIWASIVAFALAALLAFAAQIACVDQLFANKSDRRKTRLTMLAAVLLIGIGIGQLGTGVYLVLSHAPR